mgnify:CR=1 FL=1
MQSHLVFSSFNYITQYGNNALNINATVGEDAYLLLTIVKYQFKYSVLLLMKLKITIL